MAVKCEFLRRSGAKQLLVFFNGWGMDATRTGVWELPDDTDLLVLSDYTEAPAPPPAEAAEYPRAILLAWSLGVWSAAAAGWSEALPPGPRIAVNGTLTPIDAAEGIAPAVFDGTLANWGRPETREKFSLRISGTTAPVSERSADSQARELAALAARIRALPTPPNPFTEVFCGRRDRIFPFSVQQAAWNRRPETEFHATEWLHDPFAHTESRRELLTHVLR